MAHFTQADLRFDRLIGRNGLLTEPDKVALLQQWLHLLRPEGAIVLAEILPRHTQRLYALLEANSLSSKLYQRLVEAEEAIYTDSSDAMVNWNVEDLVSQLGKQASIDNRQIRTEIEQTITDIQITSTMIERWFSPGKDRPSYRDHLVQVLSTAELKTIRQAFSRSLTNQSVQWHSAIGFIRIDR